MPIFKCRITETATGKIRDADEQATFTIKKLRTAATGAVYNPKSKVTEYGSSYGILAIREVAG